MHWRNTNLGVAYHKGEGVAKDTKKAMRWYRMAADQGLAHRRNLIWAYAYVDWQPALPKTERGGALVSHGGRSEDMQSAQNNLGVAYKYWQRRCQRHEVRRCDGIAWRLDQGHGGCAI